MERGASGQAALFERLRERPVGGEAGEARAAVEAIQQEALQSGQGLELARLLDAGPVRDLLCGLVAGSPFLKGLMARDPARLSRLVLQAPELSLDAGRSALAERLGAAASMAEAMLALREFKAEVALLTGLSDLGGVWSVPEVTHALSQAADAALQGSVAFLFRQAAAKGDWRADDPARPEAGSGYIVLGMGKYGACELNYSSDIDLIVFYDADTKGVRGGLDLPTFFVRLTRDLVRLMDERTKDGYVFRTDLRLRPDAGATQVALSTEAAAIYYESFGQNWERAALIKARPVAGDLEAGEAFLAELSPFVWRKSLDFAAIADIHAMKRQIHAFRGFGGIGIPGHNIKLGPGGIREIEFFAQTQQLIAGGRQWALRVRGTLEALAALGEGGWIERQTATELGEAYLFLRRIEHRLQMVADEQTHELPEEPDQLERLAQFSGFATREDFSRALLARLELVQRHYGRLFEGTPELTSGGANMVFAGEENDPATVAGLARLGYARPADVLAAVRGWHHGRYPAVRSARARELLTDVQPALVAGLAGNADPDRAFTTFDQFLAGLPAGVQLFSLLKANPALMRLIAAIMGTAPRLARVLSRRPRLLDAVIDPRIMGTLAEAAELDTLIARELDQARDFQEVLDRARIVGSEQAFLIGVRVLSGVIGASQAGGAYALLAERLIAALQEVVEQELVRQHGRVPGGGAAVVAMGKLGGREMTASSDLDLIVVYDFDPKSPVSDGPQPLSAIPYYTRLTQRLITALSAPTPEGSLYEVDLRLRPSGQKGPVATQLSGFVDYQLTEAWTWEHLALTRARVITGEPAMRERVAGAIRDTLLAPRDRAKVARDVLDMRQRIAGEKGTDNIWDLKQIRGGLVDLEFIAQHLQLVYAHRHPDVLDQSTLGAYRKLAAKGLIEARDAHDLIAATRLLNSLTQILRLCVEGTFDPDPAPGGLKDLLARAGDAADFASLERNLRETLGKSAAAFARIIA